MKEILSHLLADAEARSLVSDSSPKMHIRPDKLDLLFLISAGFYFKHPASTFIIAFGSGTPPINSINNHVMSRETSLMASAHGHLSQARCHSFACQYYMAVGQLFRGQSLEFL